MRRRTRPVALALGALLVLSVAACSSGDEPAAEPTRERVTRSATPSAEPTPTATTPSPAPTPTAEPLPTQVVTAGTVADGQEASASGTGPAVVQLVRGGEFAIVVDLDCTACTGPVELTQEGRMSSWGEGVAPFTGSYLLDIFKGTAPEQEFILRAEGAWTVRLRSWNDLPVLTGPQSGTGAQVLLLGDTASRFDVTWAPADPDDGLTGRSFSAVDIEDSGNPASVLFGNDEAFTESYELALPGVVVMQTRGTWTVTPQP